MDENKLGSRETNTNIKFVFFRGWLYGWSSMTCTSHYTTYSLCFWHYSMCPTNSCRRFSELTPKSSKLQICPSSAVQSKRIGDKQRRHKKHRAGWREKFLVMAAYTEFAHSKGTQGAVQSELNCTSCQCVSVYIDKGSPITGFYRSNKKIKERKKTRIPLRAKWWTSI